MLSECVTVHSTPLTSFLQSLPGNIASLHCALKRYGLEQCKSRTGAACSPLVGFTWKLSWRGQLSTAKKKQHSCATRSAPTFSKACSCADTADSTLEKQMHGMGKMRRTKKRWFLLSSSL
jgi:hypothetical protein